MSIFFCVLAVQFFFARCNDISRNFLSRIVLFVLQRFFLALTKLTKKLIELRWNKSFFVVLAHDTPKHASTHITTLLHQEHFEVFD